MTEKLPTGPIAFVEIHDARLGSIEIRDEIHDQIGFDHLAVYHVVTENELYEIWSYQAHLYLTGMVSLKLDGAWAESDYVADGFLFTETGSFDWTKLLQPQAVRRIELQFGSGRRISIECETAVLILDRAIRRLRDWKGALHSAPTE